MTGVYRFAESQDIPRIIELGRQNVSNERYKRQIIDDEVSLRLFVGAILADDNSRAIVYECDGVQGIFAFTVSQNFYYFGGKLVANMVIWSVAKSFRGRVSMTLLSYAQKEARKMGATRLIMTGPDNTFGKLAEHCGFEFFETAFMKEL